MARGVLLLVKDHMSRPGPGQHVLYLFTRYLFAQSRGKLQLRGAAAVKPASVAGSMPRALRAAALLASAARAWDVRTPTNTTCLGGCACVPRLRACVPTAPAKDARVLALSLASLARHGADVAEVWVVSRRAAGVDAAVAAANRVRPVARWLDEAAHFPFDYAGVRAALGAARGRAPDGRLPVRRGLVPAAAPEALLRAGDRPRRAEHDGRGTRRRRRRRRGRRGRRRARRRLGRRLDARRGVRPRGRPRRGRGVPRDGYNYAFSREAHQLYYDTNARLLGAAGAPLADSAGRDISGVAHHMVLRGDVVAALEAAVAARHGAPLHAALFRGAAGVAANARRNAVSEYQLYFHFARRRFPASVRVRQLYWANGPGPRAVAACGAGRTARRRAADVGSRHGGRGDRSGRGLRRRRLPQLREAAAVRLRPGGRRRRRRRVLGERMHGGPASRAASTSGSSAGTAPRRPPADAAR